MKRKLFLTMLTCLLLSLVHAQEEEKNIFDKVEIEANTNHKAWAEHVRKKRAAA